MSNYKQFVSSSFAAAVVALAAVPASAQSPLDTRQTASEINAANTLLRDGKIDEAIDAYRKVVPSKQQRDELNYNLAVAEYRKGNIEAAEQLFTDVAGTSSATIAADSRYNLGNCQYAKALAAAEQDKTAAIELLREAIAHYRGALRAKPNNPDARANIELAAELIRKLEQEQKKEEQQKQNDQQQKDEKQEDQQQDKSQDSESQKEEAQKDSDQQKSDSQDPNSNQEKSDQKKNEEQMDDEQKKHDEQSAADQPQKDEQKKEEQKNDKAGHQEEQNDQQKPSEQQKSGDQEKPEDEGQPEEQDAKNQSVPTGDLKAASEQEKNKKPEGEVSMADPNAKDGLMTREEALKMLQSVRDRDMLRRMQQQRQERSRRVPVDKDW